MSVDSCRQQPRLDGGRSDSTVGQSCITQPWRYHHPHAAHHHQRSLAWRGPASRPLGPSACPGLPPPIRLCLLFLSPPPPSPFVLHPPSRQREEASRESSSLCGVDISSGRCSSVTSVFCDPVPRGRSFPIEHAAAQSLLSSTHRSLCTFSSSVEYHPASPEERDICDTLDSSPSFVIDPINTKVFASNQSPWVRRSKTTPTPSSARPPATARSPGTRERAPSPSPAAPRRCTRASRSPRPPTSARSPPSGPPRPSPMPTWSAVSAASPPSG